MALTLAQAALLSNDVVRQGVIEAIVKESGLLERLPFIEMVGNSLKYNRELTLAGAEFFAVGSTWTESTPTVEQKSAALKILGGDADVDKFLAQTRANVQDLEAVMLELKAKAVAHRFDYEAVYGDDAVDALGFDGLHAMEEEGPAAQTFAMGTTTTPGALSLKKLDEVIDAGRPGEPDFLMMTRTQRRGISAYARSLTSPVTYQPSELGQRVMFYDGIPIVVNDHQLHTEVITNGGLEVTSATGGTGASIFALKVGEGQLSGLTNGGVQVESVGALETKDATRWRCKFYCGLALFSVLAMARLGGVSSGDVVA